MVVEISETDNGVTFCHPALALSMDTVDFHYRVPIHAYIRTSPHECLLYAS